MIVERFTSYVFITVKEQEQLSSKYLISRPPYQFIGRDKIFPSCLVLIHNDPHTYTQSHSPDKATFEDQVTHSYQVTFSDQVTLNKNKQCP